jgi:hypothetical protein
MDALEPDRDMIEVFVDAIFRRGSPKGFVSVRSFFEGEDKPFVITAAAFHGDRRFQFLIDQAENNARAAAQAAKAVVFCPPLAIFNTRDSAREIDVAEGLALSVECDQHPQQARQILEELLGPATVVVRSGGTWINGGATTENKLHVHYRLTAPASGKDGLTKLKRARTLATKLVGGDASNVPPCHPIRWPGSWHRKAEPRLCVIDTLWPDIEIDLDSALAKLIAAAPGDPGKADPEDDADDANDVEWDHLVADVISGKSYHKPLVTLAARCVGAGMVDGQTVKLLRSIMLAVSAPHDARWQSRYDGIARIVTTARKKYQDPSSGTVLQSAKLSSFKTSAVVWLWNNRFALGKIGLIGGLPDRGKGLITSDIMARVTTGSSWPCSEGVAPLGNVLLFTAEDDIEDTVKPRLMAAGADLDRIEVVQMVAQRGGKPRMFNLVEDLPLLRAKIAAVGNVKLVVIDPLSAYVGVGKIDSYRSTDVRGVLGPLKELAEETRIAFVGIVHFNKNVDVTNAMLRIADSLAYVAASRHCFIVVDDTDNKRRLFVKAKNNLAPDMAALSYTIDVKLVDQDSETGADVAAPYASWGTDHVYVTATEAMAAENGSAGSSQPGSRDEARQFLNDILKAGSMAVTEVIETAEVYGISEKTLRRAQKELKIVPRKDGLKGGWVWELPPF